jgi:hypothetical protein
MSESNTNSTLVETVTGILKETGLLRMAFKVGDLEVTGSKLKEVADAISAGSIKCLTKEEFISQGTDELAAGMTVAARYEIKNDAMVFQSQNYGHKLGEDRTILHEAVHAMFDMQAGPRGKQNLAVDDEAAAVLTEAFYIRLCNKPLGGFKMMVDGPQDHALRLADEVLVETENFMGKAGIYAFRPDQLNDLREAVAKDWNFRKFKGKDGLLTDNRKLRYVYDGIPKCPGGK